MMYWTVAGNFTRPAWELPHGPYTAGPRECPRRDEHNIPDECEDSGPYLLGKFTSKQEAE
jgi:hypothetical protein